MARISNDDAPRRDRVIVEREGIDGVRHAEHRRQRQDGDERDVGDALAARGLHRLLEADAIALEALGVIGKREERQERPVEHEDRQDDGVELHHDPWLLARVAPDSKRYAASSTRLRPLFLAMYSASSARAISAVARLARAALGDADGDGDAQDVAADDDGVVLDALARALDDVLRERASTPGRTTRNSSPPQRTTPSAARTTDARSVRDAAEQLVAGGVAVGVVDVLEAIEIAHRHRRHARVVLGQHEVEPAPVEDAGQRIDLRQPRHRAISRCGAHSAGQQRQQSTRAPR